MIKALKITALLVGCVVLLIGGYLIYVTKFKEYDVADSQVEEIVRASYVLQLPEGGTLEIDEEGNVIERDAEGNIISETVAPSTEGASATSTVSTGSSSSSENEDKSDATVSATSNSSSSGNNNASSSSNEGSSKSESSSSSSGGSAKSSGSGTGSSNDGKVTTLTVAEIKAKYDPVFAGLEAQAESRLASLVSRAKSEYVEKQANGESIDYGYFYRKYSSAASNLEAATDAAFYSTLAVVQNAFVANGHNKGEASEYEVAYKARKAERRSELMSQVTGG